MAFLGALWIIDRRLRVVVLVVQVGCPFPGIAVHVVQAKCIRCKARYGCSKRIAVTALERMLRKLGPLLFRFSIKGVGDFQQHLWIVAPVVAGAGAGARGVLPLGFGRQAISLVFGLAEPACHGLCVVPGDVDDRVVVSLREARVAPAVAWVPAFELFAALGRVGRVLGAVAIPTRAVSNRLRHIARGLQELFELGHRHFSATQVKVFGNAHAVDWRLVAQIFQALVLHQRVVLLQRSNRFIATHQEFARWYTHEGHAQRVGAQALGMAARHCAHKQG